MNITELKISFQVPQKEQSPHFIQSELSNLNSSLKWHLTRRQRDKEAESTSKLPVFCSDGVVILQGKGDQFDAILSSLCIGAQKEEVGGSKAEPGAYWNETRQEVHGAVRQTGDEKAEGAEKDAQ